MTNRSPRCFTHPDVLKAVSPKWLARLLAPHTAFLESKGIVVPDPEVDHCSFDYQALSEVLMTPDSTMPRELLDSIYCIHEMASPESMDCLLEEAEMQDIPIDDPEPTSMDIAIQIWLQDRNALKRKHAECLLTKPSTFIYFQPEHKPETVVKEVPPNTLRAIEYDLDEWFAKRKRGRGCHVFHYIRDHGIWFIIGHGGPFMRTGCIENGESRCILYRPEQHDLVVYQSILGELQVHATSRSEVEMYRQLFGRHLFRNDRHFPGTAKYTLEPLKIDGQASLVCSDIEGLELIKLTELQYVWRGKHGDCETHTSDDIFEVFRERDEKIPPGARLTKACFRVKFEDSHVPRVVSIRPSNIAKYHRDSDCELVEEWLRKRGFILACCLLQLLPLQYAYYQLFASSLCC